MLGSNRRVSHMVFIYCSRFIPGTACLPSTPLQSFDLCLFSPLCLDQKQKELKRGTLIKTKAAGQRSI